MLYSSGVREKDEAVKMVYGVDVGMGNYIYAGELPWFFDQGDMEGPLRDLLYTWDDAFGVWVAVSLMFTRRDAFGVRSELRSCVYSGHPLTPRLPIDNV